jgi:hypothetical protein
MYTSLLDVCYCIQTCLSIVCVDFRFLRKTQILSDASLDEQHSSKSVLDVLKEISRKRIHAQVTKHFLIIYLYFTHKYDRLLNIENVWCSFIMHAFN